MYGLISSDLELFEWLYWGYIMVLLVPWACVLHELTCEFLRLVFTRYVWKLKDVGYCMKDYEHGIRVYRHGNCVKWLYCSWINFNDQCWVCIKLLKESSLRCSKKRIVWWV